MGKCYKCQCETNDTATVYIGRTAKRIDSQIFCEYAPRDEYFCEQCRKDYANNSVGVMFYLALQIGWLSVIKSGFFSPFGIIGALMALIGIYRLAIIGCRFVFHKLGKTVPLVLRDKTIPAEDASAALCSYMKKNRLFEGSIVRSIRDHKRINGSDKQ